MLEGSPFTLTNRAMGWPTHDLLRSCQDTKYAQPAASKLPVRVVRNGQKSDGSLAMTLNVGVQPSPKAVGWNNLLGSSVNRRVKFFQPDNVVRVRLEVGREICLRAADPNLFVQF